MQSRTFLYQDGEKKRDFYFKDYINGACDSIKSCYIQF